MNFASSILHPSQWSVRIRSTVASTLVIAFCLIIAGAALVLLLAHSLQLSAQDTSDARATQITQQLAERSATELDPSLLSTDSQIGIVQIVSPDHQVLAQSPGTDSGLLSGQTVDPGQSASFGRVEPSDDGDYWLIGRGVTTPTGPVTVFVGADREPVESVVTAVAALLAIVGPFVLGLAAFATYRLVGSALAPVERIRARVASISSGSHGERVPVPSGNDEIARLARTMNDMLARLDEGAQAQQRFVSDASHELRSPLSTITTALELAHRRPELLDDALIEDALLPEARRMCQLIDDLLTLARSDENAHDHHRTATDVDIDDILLAEKTRVAGISDVTVTAAIAPVRVTGDPRALTRLVRNLVDNAVRHAETRIWLHCFHSRVGAHIVIEDDGPGIPEAERVRIFDRFVRLDSPRSRQGGGTGLGLAIASDIATAHGGTITATERSGGGTRFEIVIPTTED
ncbi:HAMP domain-containing histidine kinase [Rhodococcus sp. KBS0724]|uniref:sensor histidine kinase n=1 Tax=Rhodococcus sp. KBS0724 TaxID=1179674 RepID=UPI00110EC4D1|nr:HAMP domain-containing sensor histidine kinase [Rhodococcus sp. KBS0724]TSD45575.1 HAMP domain-containing histidine kinase [Rhodococcus sp. KBS0724]